MLIEKIISLLMPIFFLISPLYLFIRNKKKKNFLLAINGELAIILAILNALNVNHSVYTLYKVITFFVIANVYLMAFFVNMENTKEEKSKGEE